MTCFNFPMTSVMIAWTAGLSWLHDWKTWLNVIISRSWSGAIRRVATVRCQEIPRLPNQSVWLSRYFLGKNFIAQSSISRTDVSSRLSRTSRRASSWLILLSRCAFHARMFCLDWSDTKKSSSLVSSETLLEDILWIPSSISCKTAVNSSQRWHVSWWVWSQADW